MKVMVVDDEKDVQLLFELSFRDELESGRITFCYTLSGEAALEYIEQNGIGDVSLILSDVNMPGMNGLELLQTIKDKYASLKVFMITAYGDEQSHKTAKKIGCDGYFTKPLDFDELKKKIFDAAKNGEA